MEKEVLSLKLLALNPGESTRTESQVRSTEELPQNMENQAEEGSGENEASSTMITIEDVTSAPTSPDEREVAMVSAGLQSSPGVVRPTTGTGDTQAQQSQTSTDQDAFISLEDTMELVAHLISHEE